MFVEYTGRFVFERGLIFMTQSSIQIQAHRGASAYAPENTLPAFQKALDMHADGIETDIHLTADGVFVICHDGELGRTSNGTGQIAALTLAELRQYDFGSWFSPAFAGTRIPTLEELLALVQNMEVINIEIKGLGRPGTNPEQALQQLIAQLDAFGCTGRTILSSFRHDWLLQAKTLAPQLRTGLLYDRAYSPDETLRLVREYQADAIHPSLRVLTPEIMETCREHGIAVNVWTVDEPDAIKKALEYHVTGIITNVPDRAIALRDMRRG